MEKPRLYMMMGYPGAGKTTVAGCINELTGAVHLSSDEFRVNMFNPVEHTQKEHVILYNTLDFLTKHLLKNGVSVIYDANLNRYTHRKDKYEICKKMEAKAKLIWVTTSEELSRKRATQESEKREDRIFKSNMEEPTFNRIVSQIEEPKTNEPTVKINGDNVSKNTIEQFIKD